MTREERYNILELYRKSTGLFKDEGSKESFHKVYENLSDSALQDVKNSIEEYKRQTDK